MFQHLDNISKALVLDLDAHQVSAHVTRGGVSLAPPSIQRNGYERDLGIDSKVFIADIYNR